MILGTDNQPLDVFGKPVTTHVWQSRGDEKMSRVCAEMGAGGSNGTGMLYVMVSRCFHGKGRVVTQS